MAVRVIKQEPDPTVVRRSVCRSGCGVTVEYLPNDIEKTSFFDVTDGFIFFVVCPNCKKKIPI